MNMKNMKWMVVLLVLLFSVTVVFGCTPAADEPAPPADDNGDVDPVEPEPDPLRVAMMLPGPITDQGWNATAYNGLMRIQDELGLEVAFTEQVDLSDIPEIVRAFANQGYDIIIGHGFQFGDPIDAINDEFPDIKFVVTSSTFHKAPNVASLNNDNWQQGFLAGAFSALMTESGKVGAVAGLEIPSITAYVNGYEAGVRYISDDVDYTTVFTGDFYDAVRARESADAMINAGVDIIAHNADAAGLGVFEAARDRNVWAIGSITDQKDAAPEVIVTSALSNLSDGIFEFVKGLTEGEEFKPEPYWMGIEEGIVGLAPFHDFDDQIPQDVKDRLDEIKDLLAAESIPRD